MSFDVFLTAYDPSDLPGGSIDPLGFERGYLFLADKILPGMTNVANCPRYFGMMCAGIMLAGAGDGTTIQAQVRHRRETVLRLERLWSLANVLASSSNGNGSLSGLRGVTYAQRHLDWLQQKNKQTTTCDFKLLSRQVPYGALGMYGAVAENCQLLYRKVFELTPGLGVPMAEAFIDETQIPPAVRSAVRQDLEVPLNVLAGWGKQAYLWGRSGQRERRCLSEMLHTNPIRSRFTQLLVREKVRANDTEMNRLGRIASRIQNHEDNHDLWESIECIRRYEHCYQVVMLAFERLLFLCRNRSDPTGAVEASNLTDDEVMQKALAWLPEAVRRFIRHLEAGSTEHFCKDLDRLHDVRSFLLEAATAANSALALTEAILNRHADVQHGKLDRGRRKMPWVQMENSRLSLTMTRVGGLAKEALSVEDIAAHPYRLSAADNWMKAAEVQ